MNDYDVFILRTVGGAVSWTDFKSTTDSKLKLFAQQQPQHQQQHQQQQQQQQLFQQQRLGLMAAQNSAAHVKADATTTLSDRASVTSMLVTQADPKPTLSLVMEQASQQAGTV